MSWLPSVKALVQNVGIGHAHECAEGRARDNRIQIALTTAIPLGFGWQGELSVAKRRVFRLSRGARTRSPFEWPESTHLECHHRIFR
jgi:hypothetical protein